MKKLLFSSCVALAILGCGGDQGDLPDVFEKPSSGIYSSSSGVSSSSKALSSSGSSSSSALLSSSGIASSSSSASSIIYGSPVMYGGKLYQTVVIGTQTWFQQNLEYKDAILHDWETAKIACPSGWRLPSVADWDTLMLSVDPQSTPGPHGDMETSSLLAGAYLKAESGWGNNGNGQDKYGFMALPSGDEMGDYGNWWSATTSDDEEAQFAYNWSLYSKEDIVTWYDSHISNLFSVRCLKNEE